MNLPQLDGTIATYDKATDLITLADGKTTREPNEIERWNLDSIAAVQAEAAARDAIEPTMLTLRDTLSAARSVLLAFGTQDGLSFAETYSATQTAMIEYRDSGLSDPQCDQDVAWMTARSVEIIASAAYQAGLFPE